MAFMNATKAAFGGSDIWACARSSGSRLPRISACWALSQTCRPSRSFADSSGVSAIQPPRMRIIRSTAYR
jgi:hypothetical protein